VIGGLAIVGAGLIGTSVRLAAERRWPGMPIACFDRGDALDSLHRADLVLLATPVDVILALIPGLPGRVRGGALILDTGSTKHAIVSAARSAGLARFVGGHPMAGAAVGGPGAARADLFHGKPWFLVRGAATALAVEAAHEFVTGLGARPVALEDDGEQHDRVMAAVSHLPQVVASALMARVGDAVGAEGLAWSGAGLRDTTRLAASDASVWASVLATNAGELRPLIRQLARDLDGIADRLDDADAVRELFDRARRSRSFPPADP
jgi:prephenate dehydrogenase